MSHWIETRINLGRPSELMKDAIDSLEGYPDFAQHLADYRKIAEQGREALFLRYCAAIAWSIRTRTEEWFQLNEYGVGLMSPNGSDSDLTITDRVYSHEARPARYSEQYPGATRRYDRGADVIEVEGDSEQRQLIVRSLVEVNAEFLRDWKQVCEDSTDMREALMSDMAGTVADDMQRTIDRLTPHLYRTPHAIANMFEERGFRVTNPEVLSTPASQVAQHGIRVDAVNEAGEERYVALMPNGNVITKAEIPNTPDSVCKRVSREFAADVKEVIKDLAENAGGNVRFQTARQGKTPYDPPESGSGLGFRKDLPGGAGARRGRKSTKITK